MAMEKGFRLLQDADLGGLAAESMAFLLEQAHFHRDPVGPQG